MAATQRPYGMLERAMTMATYFALMMLLLAGCGTPLPTTPDIKTPEFVFMTREISGTPGKHWSSPVAPTRGTVPATQSFVTTRGTTVGAEIRKVDPGDWTLTVCLEIEGGRRICDTTTEEFGTVKVEIKT